MVKWLMGLVGVYIISASILGILDSTFYGNTDTIIMQIVDGNIFSLLFSPTGLLSLVTMLWNMITFNYIALSPTGFPMLHWLIFALIACLSIPVIYGVIINIRGTSA